MGMFLLFSTPTLVHAETDFSQASDEEMLQELNERFAEEKASVSVQEPEAKQEEVQKNKAKVEIEKADESVETFDNSAYNRKVDKMSKSRVTNLIDNYSEKENLTRTEKEKLSILEEKFDELEKASKYDSLIHYGLILFFMGALTTIDIIWHNLQ